MDVLDTQVNSTNTLNVVKYHYRRVNQYTYVLWQSVRAAKEMWEPVFTSISLLYPAMGYFQRMGNIDDIGYREKAVRQDGRT